MLSSRVVNFVGETKKKEREDEKDFSKLENVDHCDLLTRKMTICLRVFGQRLVPYINRIK